MNLIETIDATERIEGLSDIQSKLYQILNDAIEEGRSLLIPSDIFPRRSGKTFVLERIARENSGFIIGHTGVREFRNDGAEIKRALSQNTFRGLRPNCVVIDERVSIPEMERLSVDRMGPVGFCRMDRYLREVHMENSYVQELLSVINECREEEWLGLEMIERGITG